MTGTRRKVKQKRLEEDEQPRAHRGGFTKTERRADVEHRAAVCAFIVLPLHTPCPREHRTHDPTQLQPCVRGGNCPRADSLLARDPAPSAEQLQRRRAREEIGASLPEKLDPTFSPPVLYVREDEGSAGRVTTESRRRRAGRKQSDPRGRPGDVQHDDY